MITRRIFLKLAAMTSLAPLFSACDQAPWLIGQANLPAPTASLINWDNKNIKLASHVLKRLTYGIRPGDIEQISSKGVLAFIDEQLNPETITDDRTYYLIRRLDTISLKAPDIFELTAKQAIDDLRQATILRAIYSERQLQEIMVEFWSDHFNIYSEKADCAWLKIIDDREVIRKHALGKFKDLLKASATSPAMLSYLDNSSNKIGKLNENYARELLELHTLGVNGGYDQKDVIEAAKALSGWQSSQRFWKGKAKFENNLHNPEEKEILGKNFPANKTSDLDELINLICSHPSTANFISTKLCCKFVSENPSQELILQVAKRFQESDGDIRETLRIIFNSEEFFNSPPKFKRPYTYMISALRAINANSDAGSALRQHLDTLGQLPFNWPTPDGYPDRSQHWQTQLLPRWNFAISLANNQIRGTKCNLENLAPILNTFATNLIERPLTSEELLAINQVNNVSDKVALLLSLPDFQQQ
ncbi:MAG: DUF1800 domain-containing protein [Acidobacteria bacterium]|nr:DUF1800 domain-containing protein [Acidobacteriota bacterium]